MRNFIFLILFIPFAAMAQRYPPAGAGIPTYTNQASLPTLAANGSAAITLDTFDIWIFDLGTLTWLQAGGPGSALSLGNLDAAAATAQGAALVSGVLSMQSATASKPGLVNTTTQSFAGQKTFSTGLTGTLTGAASLNVLTSALGTASELTSSVLTLSGWTNATIGSPTITVKQAATSQSGYLSSTDWNTFNGKQAAGSYITALTGGVTASGPGSAVATVVTNANLTGMVTSVGNATTVVTNANLTGGVTSVGNAATVVTNANLTGPVTSTGNATAVANGAITQAMTGATATPTASTTASWDASVNLSANNHIEGYATTATTAATRTLTVASAYQQFFTGTTSGQILQLPVTSTLLVTGFGFLVNNLSTQTVAVNSSGSNLILAQAANTTVLYTCILITGTTAASWNATVIGAGGAVTPTVSTALVTGTGTGTGGFVSGTYTTPANVAYIIVEGVGGGSGGAGSSTVAANNAGAGGAGGITTFGTSLLTANGGTATGSGGSGYTPGGGGTATITASSTVISLVATQGSGGQAGTYASGTVTSPPGGNGGASPYGGNGSGGSPASTGSPAIANTGSGGGGGGGASTTNDITGAGGGSGGYFKALIIPTPGQTFSYNVGAAGTAGTGASANAGGAGGLGAIRVTEFYNNGAIGTATTITGNLPTSQVIGTTTNSSATAGFIGEYVTSAVSGVNSGASTVTSDVTSISLTAGDWEITGQVSFQIGTGVAILQSVAGVSTTSGNSTTGLVEGDTQQQSAAIPTANSNTGITVAGVRASISGTTIYYLKSRLVFTSGQPVLAGRISARRVR